MIPQRPRRCAGEGCTALLPKLRAPNMRYCLACRPTQGEPAIPMADRCGCGCGTLGVVQFGARRYCAMTAKKMQTILDAAANQIQHAPRTDDG